MIWERQKNNKEEGKDKKFDRECKIRHFWPPITVKLQIERKQLVFDSLGRAI